MSRVRIAFSGSFSRNIFPLPISALLLARVDYYHSYSMSDTQMQFWIVSKSVEALCLRLNPVKPDQWKLENLGTCCDQRLISRNWNRHSVWVTAPKQLVVISAALLMKREGTNASTLFKWPFRPLWLRKRENKTPSAYHSYSHRGPLGWMSLAEFLATQDPIATTITLTTIITTTPTRVTRGLYYYYYYGL